MKSLALTLILILAQTSAFASVSYKFSEKVGKVTFKTKGWPNLVTIKGEGSGIKGELKEVKDKIIGTLQFDLATLKTGIALRDDHMKNKYLQVKDHPTAELTITSLDLPKNREGEAQFKGSMKLHGVTKDISGTAELEKEGEKIKVTAEFPVLLKDFKIDVPSYKGITVADKVDVKIETQAKPMEKAAQKVATKN